MNEMSAPAKEAPESSLPSSPWGDGAGSGQSATQKPSLELDRAGALILDCEKYKFVIYKAPSLQYFTIST